MQGRANTVSGHCRVVAVLGQGVTEEQGLVSTHSPTRPLPTSLLPHTQHQHLNAQWKIQYLASHPSTASPLMGSDFSRFHTKYTKMANIGLHKISQYLFCRWTSLVTRGQIWKTHLLFILQPAPGCARVVRKWKRQLSSPVPEMRSKSRPIQVLGKLNVFSPSTGSAPPSRTLEPRS